MATTAALTASTPSPTNSENSIRKTEDKSEIFSNRKPTYRRLSPNAPMNFENGDSTNFRIPKLENSEIDANSSSESTNSPKTNHSSSRQINDDGISHQGKRKLSLSQYKERKRLKSDELQQTSFMDTDMRILPVKNSPTNPIGDELSVENGPSSSPKPEETIKDFVLKSNLSEPGVRKTIKKKVIWADEKSQSLVHTSFFEVDDSELSEMHVFARNSLAHIPIAQLEKVMERDFRKRRGVQDFNAIDNDDKQFSTPLPTLIKILLPEGIQIPQIVSQERFVQEEREKTVLQALFIPAFLPDSPGEPDGDLLLSTNHERNEPKLIPLDDDSGSASSSKVPSLNNNLNIGKNSSSTPISSINPRPTVSTTNSSSTSSTTSSGLALFDFDDVSPQVANILAQAKGKLSSMTNNQSATINNLINTPTTNQINSTNLGTVSNLAAPGNFLSQLFNANRPVTNSESATPSTTTANNLLTNLLPNLPMNFNLPPLPPAPGNFPIGQLFANALSLGFPLSSPNNSLFPTATTTSNNSSNNFNVQQTNSTNQMNNSTGTTNNNTKSPSVRFVSAMGAQNRSNLNNHNDHQISQTRENSREHNSRRPPPNNNHHHHHHHHQPHHHHHRRSDFYPHRQQQQNNNNNRNSHQQ